MLAVPAAEPGGLSPGLSVPGIERFTRRKVLHRPLAMALERAPELVEYARAIANCANTLHLDVSLPEGLEPTVQLADCRPCNRRICPFCEWRRSRVWRGRLTGGLGPFFEARPTDSAVFLTLTVRNVALGDLGETIKEMHRSWNRLLQWKRFPTDFWFRRTEITVGRPSFSDGLPNAPTPKKVPAAGSPARSAADGVRIGSIDHGTPGVGAWVHPHIHALLLVPAGYWGKGYIRQGDWQQQWQMAARLDYAPVIDVRRARAKDQQGDALAGAKDAAIEAAKYTTKATDLLTLGNELPEFAHQIRSHRLVAMSSALKKFVPDHDPSANEMADERDHSLPAVHPVVPLIAQWSDSLSDYVLHPR